MATVAATAPEVTADTATLSEREDDLSRPLREQGNAPEAPVACTPTSVPRTGATHAMAGTGSATLPEGPGRGLGNTQQSLALPTSKRVEAPGTWAPGRSHPGPRVCGGAVAFRPGARAPVCSAQGALGSGRGRGAGCPGGWLPAALAALGPQKARPRLLSGAGLVRRNVLTGVLPALTVVVSYREARRGEREAVPAGWRRACVLPQRAGNETRPCFPLPDNGEQIKPRIGQE